MQGVVTCIKRSGTAVEAFIAISDIRNVRIKLPWEKAQQFLLTPQPSGKCASSVPLLLQDTGNSAAMTGIKR